MDTNTVIAVVAAIILLAIGAYLGVVFSRRQRTKRLQRQFGSEYDRIVNEVGDPREAEDKLEARIDHVKSLNIRDLTEEETERFTREWRSTQAKFVDHPLAALREANRVIKEVMSAKGYPVDDFEQRAADISVDFPDLVTNYRGMREIANKSDREKVSTEEIRQAMIHSRSLFEELVGADVSQNKKQKEKI